MDRRPRLRIGAKKKTLVFSQTIESTERYTGNAPKTTYTYANHAPRRYIFRLVRVFYSEFVFFRLSGTRPTLRVVLVPPSAKIQAPRPEKQELDAKYKRPAAVFVS